MKSSSARLLAALLGTLLLCLTPPALAAKKIYTFGVSPQKSSSELAETWAPVLAWLSAKSGVELRFSTAKSSAEFSKRLGKGGYDFCYVNPQQYTLLHKKPGYDAFAREKGRTLVGILVAGKESKISSLQELEGSTLAFSSPTSFAASVLPQAELRKLGIHFTPVYVNSHESVYLNVARGIYPAGGGIVRTFETAEPETRDALKVLMTTRGYTPHAIARHPRVAKSDMKKVQAAMIAMNDDPIGKQLLGVLKFKGLEAAVDSDWNDIRSLNLPAPEED